MDQGDDRVDWPLFLCLARFHRVQGLVWHSLRSVQADVPDEVASSLSADAEAIAAANLRSAVEARDILSQFTAANIPSLFVKGLTLGALVYSRPLLKMSWDIDLLVAPDQVQEASNEFLKRGYRLILPRDAGKLQSWHRRRKESVWAHDSGFFVELHSRLADHPRLIPDITVHSEKQVVEVAQGIHLPTLADDELFAYLCVHGASSAWFRLKWITDLAALLAGRKREAIERLYERSQQLGSGRAAAQALLVADYFFGTLSGTELKHRLPGDPASRWLARAAVRQIAGQAEPREPTAAPLGTATIHWTQLLLLPGFRFKFSELGRQAGDALSALRH